MANIVVVNALGSAVYLKATGAGTAGDPHIPAHTVDSIATALPAGSNNIGDVDVLSLVGDSPDMDSGGGTDPHAGVALVLPASGGHVVGGTGVNPIRVDPVASTVMPVSVASFYAPLSVVASQIGNAAVTASVVGLPNVVGSVNVGNWPTVQKVSVESLYTPQVTASVIGAPNVVASVIGNPAVIATVAGVAAAAIRSQYVQLTTSASVTGTLYGQVNTQATVNVAGGNVVASTIGTLFAVVNTSAPGVQDVAVRSQYVQLTNTASVIGTLYAVVNTSAPGVSDVSIRSQYLPLAAIASVLGTIYAVVNTSAAGVGDVSIRSQYIQLTNTASVIGNPAVIASVIGAANVRASIAGTPAVVGSFWNAGGQVVASVAGVAAVSIASAYAPVTTRASIAGVPTVVGSFWNAGGQVVASIAGNAAVTASVTGTLYAVVNTGAAMAYTWAPIAVSGSGVVAANIIASNQARIALVGYQLIAGGTVYLGLYNGTINAPITGSLCLLPGSGLAVAANAVPLAFTTSGRGITVGLSGSCHVGGALQYYVG